MQSRRDERDLRQESRTRLLGRCNRTDSIPFLDKFVSSLARLNEKCSRMENFSVGRTYVKPTALEKGEMTKINKGKQQFTLMFCSIFTTSNILSDG